MQSFAFRCAVKSFYQECVVGTCKSFRQARGYPQPAAASQCVNYKLPRAYVFVAAIPKSPVGKLLRRQLVAGAYEAEAASDPSAAA